MKRVHDTVIKAVSARQSEAQTPTNWYLLGARGTDSMKELVVQTQRVLVIVPEYTGPLVLPGAKASAQYFLRHVAPSHFSEACRFEFLINHVLELPDMDITRELDFTPRVAFRACTQDSVRAKLEEAVQSGENVMVKFFCHGQRADGDEYVYFEDGNESERITGKYIATLLNKFRKGRLVVIADMCLAGGFPDRGDLQEVALVARVVEADTSPSAPCVSHAMIPLLNRLCDSLAPAPQENCRVSMSYKMDLSDDASRTVLNMSKDGPARSITFESGKPVVLPSAPPALAPAEDLKPRNVALAGATVLAGVTTLINSLSAAWSVGSAMMAGLPAFFASNAPTLMFVPLVVAGIVIAISALAALGFYLCFIRRHYAQVLSPVVLMTLLTAAGPYLFGPEFMQRWFASDTMLGSMRGSFVVSFATILLVIAMNWRKIRRSDVATLVFKNLFDHSGECLKLGMLLVHTHFVGGGQNYRQTVLLKVGGIDHYVVYHPRVVSKRTGELTCAFKTPGGKYVKLFEDSQFTLFNETYGITCDYEVFRALVSKYSRGEADALCTWERDGLVYDLSGLRESRLALIKQFESVTQDTLERQMDFDTESCELSGSCFPAPPLQANFSVSYVEKGLEEISEPFQRLMDGVSAILRTTIQSSWRSVRELAYPKK